MVKPKIHRSAVVSSTAKLSQGVEIGPYCIVGKHVKIGENTRLVSHISFKETEIGSNCVVYPFTSIGLAPQDTKYKNEKSGVRIGDNNIIRENITIHRASVDGDGLTEIGDNNFIMAYSHIAHDCKVGSNTIMSNATTLAGHVEVEDFTVFGGLVAVHQFVRIGAFSMIGGLTGVSKDIPPYTTASGNRAKLYGLNSVGLKRNDFSDSTIKNLKCAYKILFSSKMTLNAAIDKVKRELKQTEEIKHLIKFLEKNLKRGICR